MSESTVPDTEDHIQNHEFGAANSLMMVGMLFLCIAAGYYIQQQRFAYLPESGASMLVGVVVGLIARFGFESEDELDFLRFNPQIFFFILLPPIIFEAGYTLKKKRFFSNITAIALYAVVGTFVSTFVIGMFTFFFAKIGLIGVDANSPLQSFLFGSLISSVDPVATLAILGSAETNCDPLLYSLVFGESVLNDAVAIVLFHVMNSYQVSNREFESSDMLYVLLRFFIMTFSSVCVGVCCGLVCSFVMKNTNIREYHSYEIQLLFLFSFGCFALAELIEMSGVVSLFFCSVTLAHYNYYNLSVHSQISSRYVFEAMAKTSETIVFAYMGVSLFTAKARWDPIFVVLGILLCIMGRACNIFPMTWLANLCRRDKITPNMQFFMFFSGLRGAVSYALSQQIGKDTGSGGSYGVQVIQTTTMGIVIFTTFFLGGTTGIALETLNLKGSSGRGGGNQLREDFTRYHQMPSALHVSEGEDDVANGDVSALIAARQRMHSFWRRFDNKYMKRMFGGKEFQKNPLPPHLFEAIFEGESNRDPGASVADEPEPTNRSPLTSPNHHTMDIPQIRASSNGEEYELQATHREIRNN